MSGTAPSETLLPTTPTPAPAAPKAPPNSAVKLALILVAAFMVVLDFSIVNVALPSIERELHMAPDAVQWIVTGYAISFGGLLILGGRAADLFGRRRMFIIGLVAFALASLAGGLARDPALLLAARVLQGAGAAIVAPAALSLITTSFPEGPLRTRAIGLYGAIASVGFVSGQVLGGVLVQFTSWRAVFLVNVPVGLAAAALAPAILGQAKAATRTVRRPGCPRRPADHLCRHGARVRRVPGRCPGLDVPAGHRRRRHRRRGGRGVRQGGGEPSRAADPPVAPAPPRTAQRQYALVPAGPVERRRDARPVPVPAAGAARIPAVHRPGHRPAGCDRVHHGPARAAPGPPYGHQPAAGPDRRRGRDRFCRADPPAGRRLQPAPAGGDADRVRDRGDRVRVGGAGQPRHGRR